MARQERPSSDGATDTRRSYPNTEPSSATMQRILGPTHRSWMTGWGKIARPAALQPTHSRALSKSSHASAARQPTATGRDTTGVPVQSCPPSTSGVLISPGDDDDEVQFISASISPTRTNADYPPAWQTNVQEHTGSSPAPGDSHPNVERASQRSNRERDEDEVSRFVEPAQAIPVESNVATNNRPSTLFSCAQTSNLQPGLSNMQEDYMPIERLRAMVLEICFRKEMLDTTATGNNSSFVGFEQSRLRYLQEACETGDFHYIVLHQTFSLLSHEASSSRLLRVEAAHIKGMLVLATLLGSNAHVSLNTLHWFSTFPDRFDSLLTTWPTAVRIHQDALDCLAKLGASWIWYTERCVRARLPPSANEIESAMGVRSHILQRIIHTSCQASFSAPPCDRCFHECMEVLFQDQKNLYQWESRRANNDAPTVREMAAYQEYLVSEYHMRQVSHIAHQQPLQGCDVAQSVSQPRLERPRKVPRLATLDPQGAISLSTNSSDFYFNHMPIVSASLGSRLESRTNQCAGSSGTQIQATPTLPLTSTPDMVTPNRAFAAASTGQNRQEMHEVLPASTLSHNHLSSPATTQAWMTQPPYISTRPNPVFLFGDDLPALLRNGSHVPRKAIIPDLLFAPYGYKRQVATHARFSAIHQAHLRDDRLLPASSSEEKFFSYIKSFLIKPLIILPTSVHEWGSFMLTEADHKLIPPVVSDSNVKGKPDTRTVVSGSRVFRLRCAKADNGVGDICLSRWAAMDTAWPSELALVFNNAALEIRRKAVHGKDLAVDITRHVKAGLNVIQASILPVDPVNTNYYLAIEMVEIGDLASVRAQIREVDAGATRQRIKNQFARSDSDVEIINKDLTIKLADPFTATLVRTPTRGRACLHYECFDLDVFLKTRQGSLSRPELFICPICGNDARPMSLQIDNWFVAVLKAINETGRSGVKAITVDQNAEWRVREEDVEGEQANTAGDTRAAERTAASATMPWTKPPWKEATIIELDD